MRYRSWLPVVALTAGLTSIIVLVADTASAQRQQNQQAQKQRSAANAAAATNVKDANDSKKQADAKVDDAKKKMTELNDSMKAAQKEVDEATKALRTAEDEIVDGQSAESDFGKVRDQFRAADKKYQDARKSVLESPDFKERLTQARESDESATAVLALKKEFDEMPEIAEPRTKLKEIRETYEPLRAKLWAADSKWVDAEKVVKEKKSALDDLKKQYSEATAAANKAKADAKKAAAAVAAANAAAANQPVQQQPPRKKGGGGRS